MTRALSRNEVEVATPADLRAAIEHALERAGCTFDELAAQAKAGRFDSMRARLAWVAIGDLYRVDLGSDV
jgi:DNA mismatch repair protein MutH